MHKMQGVGLPNVFLLNGFSELANGQLAYAMVDDLFFQIALAISTRSSLMTAAELRFLRKRLKLTQEDVGALGNKSSQIALAWEKGSRPVPMAEGNLLRLLWLRNNAKSKVFSVLDQLRSDQSDAPICDYLFRLTESNKWVEEFDTAHALARLHAGHAMSRAISLATSTAKQAMTAATSAGIKIIDSEEGPVEGIFT